MERATVECGYLVVAETRAEERGRTLRLAVTVVKSRSPNRRPDPVMYLHGGPGGSAVPEISHWLALPLLEHRDFIVLDRRGTGRSGALCPDLFDQAMAILARDDDVGGEQVAHLRAALDCRDELLAEGVDLGAYNSAASAADLEDLRQALGYERWNLLGISYGTRLALTTVRDFPQGVRSVVLHSTVAPESNIYADWGGNVEQAISRLAQQCAREPTCRQEHPRLEEDFYELLDEVGRQPLKVQLRSDAVFPDGQVIVNRQDLVLVVDELSYRALRAVLPALIGELRDGRTDSLSSLIGLLVRAKGRLAYGTHYAVQCFEELPFYPRPFASSGGRLSLADVGFHNAVVPVCERWSELRASPRENQPVSSPVPVLILAGEFDSRTPPRYGQQAAATLPNSFSYVVPGVGHGAVFEPCTARMMNEFLERPDVAPDSSCLSGVETLPLVSDVYTSNGPLRLLAKAHRGDKTPFIVVGSLVLVLVSAVVYWPLLAVARRWRSRAAPKDAPHVAAPGQARAMWVAGLTALLGVIFAVLVAACILDVIDSGQLAIIALGLPAELAPLFVVPKVMAVAAIWMLEDALMAWIRRTWLLSARVQHSIVLLACVGFLAFLMEYDLF